MCLLSLIVHLLISTMGVSTSYKHKCHLCDYKARIPLTLKEHINFIHFKKKIPCDECNAEVASSKVLQAHKRFVHRLAGTFLHKCEICNKEIKQGITTHLKLVHGSDDRKFSCDECKRTFKHASHLKVHKNIHTYSGCDHV